MSNLNKRKGILQRLAAGPVVGDGSMLATLEKRGYCKAGQWTPEAVILYPDAVRQLLREYLRAGADVLQTPCFYSSDEKLRLSDINDLTTGDLNSAACQLAREVAEEGDALVCGGITPTLSFSRGRHRDKARREFESQLRPFIQHDVDFVLAEFFSSIEELEICIDVMKSSQKPIACTMRIGPMGDEDGVSVEECTVKMVNAGASIIGVNCLYDVNTALKVMKRMKASLEKNGLETTLMCQPIGWMCPEVEHDKRGFLSLPDYPFSWESRTVTRSEMHKFARAAYDIGVRYIGGCCGTEPHHIRAISQELAAERRKVPPVNDMCPPHGKFLKASSLTRDIDCKTTQKFWYNVNVASGRPDCSPTNQIVQ